jgi:transposase
MENNNVNINHEPFFFGNKAAQLKLKNDALTYENEILIQENEILEAKVKHYEEQIRLSAQQKYGASSEKTNAEQISFFNEAEKLSAQPSEEPNIEDILKKRKTKKTKTRKTYEDLEVEEVYYTLSEEEQVCPTCNHALHEMKTEVRKELKVIPAQVKMVHHIKQVFACRNCDETGTTGTIITAPMPKPVLEGSMVSPSVLAFIMERKYNQALPLYRQEQNFKNFGIDISRQNMASWIIHGANAWLKKLYDRLHVFLKDEAVIHADESPLQVLDEKNNKKNFMWLYASAKSGTHPIYLYEYQPSRAHKHPKTFLEGFTGYLQSDGYPGYNKVEGVIQVGCLAHYPRNIFIREVFTKVA